MPKHRQQPVQVAYLHMMVLLLNGNITAYAAEATNSSRGIECNGDITISGGTVAAKAEKERLSATD